MKFGRRSSVAALSLAIAATLGLTACSGNGINIGSDAANTVDPGFAETVDGIIANALQQSGSTAAVVGVWTRGGDYVTAYGEGVTANSAIRGAQTTQPALCAALLDLVDNGTLSLDREVHEDLPRQAGIDGITYGQLCTHTSGLANFSDRFTTIFANNPTRPWNDRELLAESLAVSPLSWPGIDVHLSDANALLLARALHNVTGLTVPELLTTQVYAPAGMGSTELPEDIFLAAPLPAPGMNGLTYPAIGGMPQCDAGIADAGAVSPSMLNTAGGSVTTVTDLKKFYEHYLGGTFGGQQASRITEVISTTNPNRNAAGEPIDDGEDAAARLAEIDNPNGQKWGFGVEKTESLYGRSGAITGTLTASYHDPSTGFSVVVALNNSSAGAGFARTLAFTLAAAAKEAGVGPEVTWSTEELAGQLAAGAICQPAPEEAPAEEELVE